MEPLSSQPLIETLRMVVPASAAGADDSAIIGAMPFDGEVTAVRLITKTGITGAATNHRAVALVNKGAAGSGTTSLAALAFDAATVTTTALVPKVIPLSTSPAANEYGVYEQRRVSEGDVLVWTSTHVGTGIADPGGTIEIDLARVSNAEYL
jgi:hypothetical protein